MKSWRVFISLQGFIDSHLLIHEGTEGHSATESDAKVSFTFQNVFFAAT